MSLVHFAIETSCDETSASVLKDNEILSNIISSQKFHTEYGGIVPELASRAHISIIDKISNTAFEESGINAKEIDLVSATRGPGLIGSLLVGLNYAKAFSIAKKLNFLGINHIESHLYSCFIGQKEIEFPFVSLIVSGGHTILVLVKDYFKYQILGQTQDDAAGEAFDKAAKMLGLGYPGGPLIDRLAGEGDENFHKFPISYVKENPYDFSFSGIKTSLLYYLRKNYINSSGKFTGNETLLRNISASYQKAVVDTLIRKTMMAADKHNINRIAVSGGVSANSRLRAEFNKYSKQKFLITFPEKQYSTDNAAMTGYTAYLKYKYCKGMKSMLDEPAFARFDYDNF
jgi:N6-L-threonylcarbamoyladenine synthase